VSKSQSAHPLMFDLARGLLGRCPYCGKGRMFRAFLKVNDRCDVCGEELSHHRADDFPAYIVIFIVGHLLVPTALSVETHFAPPYWVHLALWLPAILILTIGLLQPVKGAIVALQWHLGMHGFEQAKAARSSSLCRLRVVAINAAPVQDSEREHRWSLGRYPITPP
jgi:uncharacterized protein (DUF983 family)